ncbi:hypothetical protein [Thioalkalivibrio sp. ALE20]|uniref:hypothetical protein n=1 Tax=Thioalkalivibrio sp. ALE20 TaxID=545275 RepID=UPI0003AAB26A|nr:hypothetical protein [Thioalkalivibrio sp. ALE20]
MANGKAEKAAVAQKHQNDKAGRRVGELNKGADELTQKNNKNSDLLGELEDEIDQLMANEGVSFDREADIKNTEIDALLSEAEARGASRAQEYTKLDYIEFEENFDWQGYDFDVERYLERSEINLSDDPFSYLLSERDRIKVEKRIDQDLTFKTADCDKVDYAAAAVCGAIGGVIDVVLIQGPGEGGVSELTDEAVDKSVRGFAKLMGWEGPREGSDPTNSAIGFLERNFSVNYDHRHGGDVGGSFKMSTKNHHIKSLGHSPDLVGLFFSILDQFNDTASFVSDGQLVQVETENFELKGSNFFAKLFCGFVNWFGHLMSDAGGSSGGSGRGSGIPIPFYSLLQFFQVGEFGQHKDTFAKVAVKVFEEGYDFRHGLAMAIPVAITEILTRFVWAYRQVFQFERDFRSLSIVKVEPELNRMLVVSHGVLCVMDGTDAAARSGGDIVSFFLRANLVAWVRLAFVAKREIQAIYKEGRLDIEMANKELDVEYERLIKTNW